MKMKARYAKQVKYNEDVLGKKKEENVQQGKKR